MDPGESDCLLRQGTFGSTAFRCRVPCCGVREGCFCRAPRHSFVGGVRPGSHPFSHPRTRASVRVIKEYTRTATREANEDEAEETDARSIAVQADRRARIS
jgi:hypothetical protein